MRRSSFNVQPDEIRTEISPRYAEETKRNHPVLFTVLVLFVLAGVATIACFMTVIMPRQLASQADEQVAASLRMANVGDVVRLGTYEQDNDLSDGAEAIEWIVLARQNDRVLLISRFALDYAPFNTGSALSTWDYSTLLQWLNQSFFTTAFTNTEQSIICLSRIEAGTNMRFRSDFGSTTRSRVFLLSLDEAKDYFTSATPTTASACRPRMPRRRAQARKTAAGGCARPVMTRPPLPLCWPTAISASSVSPRNATLPFVRRSGSNAAPATPYNLRRRNTPDRGDPAARDGSVVSCAAQPDG